MVFVSLPDTAGPELPAKNDIYVSDFEGTNIARITSDECSSVPHWSPNGRTILFVSRRAGGLNLFVMSPDGSNVRQITRHGNVYDGQHLWSPDGNKIAYVYSSPQSGAGTIHVVNADGSGDTDTGAPFAYGFDWLR